MTTAPSSRSGTEALVVARHPRRVDDVIETTTFEDRRRLHVELGELGLTGLPRAEKPGGLAAASSTKTSSAQLGPTRRANALAFHACPEDGHAPAGKRRDASDQRHAAMVHRRSQASVNTEQGRGHDTQNDTESATGRDTNHGSVGSTEIAIGSGGNQGASARATT